VGGVIYSEVYEENTNVDVVKGSLERQLSFCGRRPTSRSVMFMDKASFPFFPIECSFGSVRNRIRKRSREERNLYRATSSRTRKYRSEL